MIFEANKYHMTRNGSKVICERGCLMIVVEGSHGGVHSRGKLPGEYYFCDSVGRYKGHHSELDIIGDWDLKSPERIITGENTRKFNSDNFEKVPLLMIPHSIRRDFFIPSRRLDSDGFFTESEHPRYEERERYTTSDGSSVEFLGLSFNTYKPTFYIVSSKNHHLKQGDIYFTDLMGKHIGRNRGLDIKEVFAGFEEGKHYKTTNDSKVLYLGNDNFKIIQSGKKDKTKPWILGKDEVYKVTARGSCDGFVRELDILGVWNEESI